MVQDQFSHEDGSCGPVDSETSTRRNFVAGAIGVVLGLRGRESKSTSNRAENDRGSSGQSADEALTSVIHDGEPLDAQPSFIDPHSLYVGGGHFDRVELQMYNGATAVFMVPWPEDATDEGDDATEIVFAFSSENGSAYEHWAEMAIAHESYDAFNGPIQRAEISTYEGDAMTITNDVHGAIDSVEFTRSTVTVSVIGDEWRYNPDLLTFRFADGSRETLTDASIYGSRTFEFPGKVLETAQFGGLEYELLARNVAALDDPDWKTVTIDGRTTDSQTDYRLQVSGALRAEHGVGTGDSIRGSTAEGFIQAGIDKYRFTGRLVQSELTGGDAILYVDGHRRDRA